MLVRIYVGKPWSPIFETTEVDITYFADGDNDDAADDDDDGDDDDDNNDGGIWWWRWQWW